VGKKIAPGLAGADRSVFSIFEDNMDNGKLKLYFINTQYTYNLQLLGSTLPA
jgi:hypothetical protein